MKGIEKKIAALLFAALMLTFGSSISLSDKQNHWSKDEIQYSGEKSIISGQDYLLNNQTVSKNTSISVKDQKNISKDESKLPEKPRDNDSKSPKEGLTAKLDKDKYYTVGEKITVSGKVIKDKAGLKNLDITLKVSNINGKETLTVEQCKSDENGDFVFTFSLPEEVSAGKYRVIVKANEPINKSIEMNFELIEEEYKLNVSTDKIKCTIDEDIIISGTALKGNIGLSNIDITLKVMDKKETQTITVEQAKTGENGEFVISFKLPNGTATGDYKAVIKANNPVEKIKEIEIKVK